MSKAIFLDRDGTINVEKQYLYRKEDFEFLPGVLEGLQLLQDAGFLLIVITNQSGIARGYYKEEDFLKLNSWMIKEFFKGGINITKVYYCPHLPDAPIEKYRTKCNCRKPALGLFEQAIKEFNIDLSNSFTIGDKMRDCIISLSTSCRGYLVGNNEDNAVISEVQHGKFARIKYAKDLYHCALEIIKIDNTTLQKT